MVKGIRFRFMIAGEITFHKKFRSFILPSSLMLDDQSRRILHTCACDHTKSAQEVIAELSALKQKGIAPEMQVIHVCT